MIIGHFTANEILLTYIYSFHMPAFFIISGYLYKPHSWKGTIQAFAIPFIFLSLINIIIQLVIGELSFHELCSINILSRFIHYRYGLGHGFFMGDWFLWALIGLRFLFGDINQLKILRKYYIPIAVICVIYMTFENNLLSIDTLFRGYYIGHEGNGAVARLGYACFEYALAEYERATRLNGGKPTKPDWADIFTSGPYIADIFNQAVYPKMEYPCVPPEFRMLIPSETIKEAWLEE